MASISDLNLDSIPEQQLPEPGDHALNIVSIKAKLSKKGSPMLQVVLEATDVEDPANTESILNFFMLPTDDMDEKMQQSRRRDIAEFIQSADIDASLFETEIVRAVEALDAEDADPSGVKIEGFNNTPCRATIAWTKYEGRDTTNVKRWL